jgi:hypothetical protein
VTLADEPDDDETPIDPFAVDDEDEGPGPVPTWLGAVGQMAAAALIVAAIVAAFIAVAAALRRLLP